MKTIVVALLCMFSTVAFATPKDDFAAANAACWAANPDPNSPALQQCVRDAWAAFTATKTGQNALAKAQAKVTKK